jgi:hypothetical protein
VTGSPLAAAVKLLLWNPFEAGEVVKFGGHDAGVALVAVLGDPGQPLPHPDSKCAPRRSGRPRLNQPKRVRSDPGSPPGREPPQATSRLRTQARRCMTGATSTVVKPGERHSSGAGLGASSPSARFAEERRRRRVHEHSPGPAQQRAAAPHEVKGRSCGAPADRVHGEPWRPTRTSLRPCLPPCC